MKTKIVEPQPNVDWIPYKNKRNQWVWHQPNGKEDPNWPGIKSPKGFQDHPTIIDGRWVFVEL